MSCEILRKTANTDALFTQKLLKHFHNFNLFFVIFYFSSINLKRFVDCIITAFLPPLPNDHL